MKKIFKKIHVKKLERYNQKHTKNINLVFKTCDRFLTVLCINYNFLKYQLLVRLNSMH